MVGRQAGRQWTPRRGTAVVIAVQVTATAMVVGWLAGPGESRPDDGLLQIDVLTLSEPVQGVEPVDGRPTMVVLTCPREQRGPVALDASYGLVVSTDRALAERVRLPDAVSACRSGYVLVDADGLVRYRTYDPGWRDHAQEQEILLEHLDGGHG